MREQAMISTSLDVLKEEAPHTKLQEGILLVNKPESKTSFSLIRALRRLTGIQKIGHAGTLDPFATGVMVCLIGKQFTRLSDQLLSADKEYLAVIYLGVTTDSYDCDGKVVARSKRKPHADTLHRVLEKFQGTLEQIPPMYSAKKIDGKKLYELARQGKTIERLPATVSVHTEFMNYTYPHLSIKVRCSKGTYIRSLAHDIGESLGCGAHLCQLQRIRSGPFLLENCLDGNLLFANQSLDISPYLLTNINDFIEKK